MKKRKKKAKALSKSQSQDFRDFGAQGAKENAEALYRSIKR